MHRNILPAVTAAFVSLLSLPISAQTQSYKFDFGPGKVEKGYTQVLPETRYTKELGYGFYGNAKISAVDRAGKQALKRDFCTSDQPFYFTVDVPEGNYEVTVTFGDPAGTSNQTVRAESRRLMLPSVVTQKGEMVQKTFTVNVRYPEISATEKVRLKPRELGYLNWDHQLTLEFNGTEPKISALEIAKNDKAATVFLAGNSTVVDQDREPWAAWGQMIPAFFQSGKVAVANHAESGEALKSFLSEKRLDKILSLMKKGDYLFIEFAHNDQKPGSAHVEPFTTYKEALKTYINGARQKGGIPVLVTSMHRRNFDSTGHIVNTLGDYPEAMRQTAKEEGVALIDLNAMSKVLYEAWGVEPSLKAFVHYPANTFPGQDKEIKDNTHFSTYGAYEIARCIAEGIRKSDLDLAKYLKADIPAFDPAKPDPIENWNWPLSPMMSAIKPDGN
ncbi:rhamnogalacturonan acetylesterase [Tellurirhabdus bombi]|uniref:rhamnogalacturonan acetylesterase n=1 Tax=Tellurirhabdus bombi TaxID=2907205 RepID=UPI001F3F2E5F|nr:GDSL-type esterase/lipase family protein [Tellurirhabdus bombi]